MLINPMGSFIFQSPAELTFNLLNAMGMGALPDGTIIDIEAGNAIIQVSGKSVKATVRDNNIKYAGEGEIMFEPLTNIKLLTSFMGRVLDKFKEESGLEVISYFPEEIEDANNTEIKLTRLCIKWSNSDISYSNFYHNKCLSIIETIFNIADMNVDLTNLDVME